MKFYHDKIGRDITEGWSSLGAVFFSTGGIYHRHIAINTWHSFNRGSHMNGKDAGLDGFTLIIPDKS
jgi:catechol-2,3-dioxygenase